MVSIFTNPNPTDGGMSPMAKLRQALPEWDQVPDKEFADAVYNKYYSDMPRDDFDRKFGYAPTSVAEDVIKSFGTGVARGAADLPGIVGNIGNAISGVGDWAYRNITGSEPPPHKTLSEFYGIPSGQDIRDAASAALPSVELHEPQTIWGNYAETAGEFTPGAIVLGGGNTLPTIGKAALKYGILPGIASEGAGEGMHVLAPKAPALEGIARGVAPLIVGGGFGAMERSPKGVPAGDLPGAIKKTYADSKAFGVKIKPSAMQKIADDVTDAAYGKGVTIDTIDVPEYAKVRSGISRLHRAASRPDGVDLEDLDKMREWINKSVDHPDSHASGVALAMKKALDSSVDNLNSAHVVSRQDPRLAVQYLKQARKLFSMKAKSDTVEELVRKAALDAKGSSDPSNIQPYLRTHFKQFLKNKDNLHGFSRQEINAMEKVVGGTPLPHIVRALSKFAPNPVGLALSVLVGGGLGSTLGFRTGSLAGAGVGASLSATGLTAAGAAAKKFDKIMTTRAAEGAGEAMRGAKPLDSKTGLGSSMINAAASHTKPDYNRKPGPLELTITEPVNIDAINAKRRSMGLDPIKGGSSPEVPTGP